MALCSCHKCSTNTRLGREYGIYFVVAVDAVYCTGGPDVEAALMWGEASMQHRWDAGR